MAKEIRSSSKFQQCPLQHTYRIYFCTHPFDGVRLLRLPVLESWDANFDKDAYSPCSCYPSKHITHPAANKRADRNQIQTSVTNNLAVDISRIQPSVSQIQGMLQRLLTSPETLPPLRLSSKSSQNVVFRFQTTLTKTCNKLCECNCHAATKASTPKWMTGLLGLLFIFPRALRSCEIVLATRPNASRIRIVC